MKRPVRVIHLQECDEAERMPIDQPDDWDSVLHSSVRPPFTYLEVFLILAAAFLMLVTLYGAVWP